MKFFHYLFSVAAFSPPTFPQNNMQLEIDSPKLEISEFDENNIVVTDSTKELRTLKKKLKDLQTKQDKIRIMPIPPSSAYKGKIGLLPLYRPGMASFKFLNKQHSKDVTVVP